LSEAFFEMKFSVAMCTYNGALYLREQLESIAAQSRPPDELIICDDRSSDDTEKIIESFSHRAPFAVRLYVNQEQLGSTKNFEKAIALCEGDIIALSDQDDFWYPEKLKRFEDVFSKEPRVGYVFTDAQVVDEALRPTGYGLWQCIEFDEAKQTRMRKGRGLDLLLLSNIVTGATMAFRSRFRELILPIPDGLNMIHDGWIALAIAVAALPALISEPLIKYRQHPHQQMGAGLSKIKTRKDAKGEGESQAATSEKSSFWNQLYPLRIISERVAQTGERFFDQKGFSQLEALMIHFQRRANMPRNRLNRISPIMRELIAFRYHLYSNGVYSAAKDLLL
jgi:glycosyltransferase involved in cell wall biosynthesis